MSEEFHKATNQPKLKNKSEILGLLKQKYDFSLRSYKKNATIKFKNLRLYSVEAVDKSSIVF